MTSHITISQCSLTRQDLSAAASVAALAMRDNPLHHAALGRNPDRRENVMRHAFERFLRAGQRTAITAWDDHRLVGIAAHAAVGRCRPTAMERLASAPIALRAGRSTLRIMEWQAEWERRDMRRPHSHLGPVAVLPELQGHGVGSQLLDAYSSYLDRTGLAGYLETDKEINVEFYRRAGFRVVGSADVIGVMNWFMTRPESPGSASNKPAPPRPAP